MIPTIEIGNIEITAYSIMWLIGLFVTAHFILKDTKKTEIDENDMIVMLLVTSTGILAGSHLLYGATNYEIVIYLFENPENITSFSVLVEYIFIILGGAVFYGGLLGGLAAGYIYIRKTKMDLKTCLFLIVPYIPLFHGISRIGCFLSGCCFGIECQIGFIYEHAVLEIANHVTRFPVQLVESLFNFFLFFLLLHFRKKDSTKNLLLPIYLIIYASGRFVLEFFRGDELRGIFWGVSTSQIISILIILSTAIFFIRLQIRKTN